MNLLELCEPLFQFVTCVNRSSKRGARDFIQTRREIDEIFRNIRSRAEREGSLYQQFEQVERPLKFFVDHIFSTGAFPFANEWSDSRLAYELDPPDVAPDESFFVLLDEALKDKSEAGAERIAVFYTCMGLGMRGMYHDQPAILRSKMQECSVRMRGMLDTTAARVCPSAYENIDDRKITLREPTSIWYAVIVLAVMAIGLVTANYYLFKNATSDLKTSLDEVKNRGS
jgi:type IV/VI secretion system ImpK/VasF family protein